MDEPGHLYVVVCDSLLQAPPKSIDVIRAGSNSCDKEKPYNGRSYAKFYDNDANEVS